MQLALLRELLAALRQKNRMYSPRLTAAGLNENVESIEAFQRQMPFTTKADLVAAREAEPPYGTNLTYPLARYTRYCQTSGTTAEPLAILDTPESWSWMLGNWAVIYAAANITRADRIYFAFSFGPFLGFWTAFEAATRLGCLAIPGGGLSSAARARAILRHEATVLCCTPTYALHLAASAAAEGVNLAGSSVKKILVAGEPGGSVPETRRRISEAWGGAEVIDHYGLTETGPVAYQCTGEPETLRIIETSYLAEIIDPATGAPTPPGAQGELVLTPLGRLAFPLLRYRTGDLVRRDLTRDGFVLAGGALGRVDDMVVVRGVNIYPAAVEAAVRTVPGIDEFRVVVTKRGEMAELSLEVESAEEAAPAALERALVNAFTLRIPVRRVESGALPRFEMKARRWVSQG